MPRHQSRLLQSHEGAGVAHGHSLQHLVDGARPLLGLSLRKSSSLVNLIQAELAQAAKERRQVDSTESAADTSVLDAKPIAKRRTKASNFQAFLLRIGAWECKSRYDGDLVAKLYFAHKKLVWEILHEGLKNKIEIQWSDISALKVTCPEGGAGTLDITLSGKPQFFRETSPRPQRNTVWLPTTDFTGGQASTHRHVLQCAPGIMNKHIEYLLSSDHRLYLLSQQNTINPENCCLQPWHSVSDVPKSSNLQFGPQQFGESFPPHSMSIRTSTGGINYNGDINGMPILFPSSVAGTSLRITEEHSGWRRLKRDVFNRKKSLQMPPGTQPFRSNGVVMSGIGNHINNEINPWNFYSNIDWSSSRTVLPEETRNDSTTDQQVNSGNPASYADGSSQCDSNDTQTCFQQTDSGNPLSNDNNISSNRMALEQIYQNMLSDGEVADAAEEEGLMRTVSSFSSLLEQAPAAARSSQASNAQVTRDVEATQALNDAPSGRSGGSDGNQLLPSTRVASVPWEEPLADIDMDLAYLSELLPYVP